MMIFFRLLLLLLVVPVPGIIPSIKYTTYFVIIYIFSIKINKYTNHHHQLCLRE